MDDAISRACGLLRVPRLVSGDEDFVFIVHARKVVSLLSEWGISIVGLEGFRLEDGTLVVMMDHVADFSREDDATALERTMALLQSWQETADVVSIVTDG